MPTEAEPAENDLRGKKLRDALENFHAAALASAKARLAPEKAEAASWLKLAVRRLSEALADVVVGPEVVEKSRGRKRPIWK